MRPKALGKLFEGVWVGKDKTKCPHISVTPSFHMSRTLKVIKTHAHFSYRIKLLPNMPTDSNRNKMILVILILFRYVIIFLLILLFFTGFWGKAASWKHDKIKKYILVSLPSTPRYRPWPRNTAWLLISQLFRLFHHNIFSCLHTDFFIRTCKYSKFLDLVQKTPTLVVKLWGSVFYSETVASYWHSGAHMHVCVYIINM